MGVISIAVAQTNNPAMARFQTLYNGLTKAYSAKDVDAAGKYFADDYASGNSHDPLTKKKVLDQLRYWDGVFKTESRKVLLAVTNGNKATVTVESITKGQLADQHGIHHYVITTRSLDTWIQKPSGWQILHQRVVMKAVTKDGKALPSKFGTG